MSFIFNLAKDSTEPISNPLSVPNRPPNVLRAVLDPRLAHHTLMVHMPRNMIRLNGITFGALDVARQQGTALNLSEQISRLFVFSPALFGVNGKCPSRPGACTKYFGMRHPVAC